MDKRTIEDLFWSGTELGYLTTTGAWILSEGLKRIDIWGLVFGPILILLGLERGYRYRKLKKKLLGEEQ
jgi:hypothetical protein